MAILKEPIKITGKEYQRKLLPLEIVVHSFTKSWVDITGPKIEKIWSKRRCFVCRGKFHHGTKIGIALSNKGNKLICEKCCEGIEV